MFLHTHPYKPYFPENVSKIIVGTLPPPRFTTGVLKPDDVNFCYGSRDGLLWPVLDGIFKRGFTYDNSERAVLERKNFLETRGIGICDIVASCERVKIDASDLGMTNVKLRNILHQLRRFPGIHTILFTGGNSKNGPEYFFRKQLKANGLKLNLVSNDIPRIHQFRFEGRQITTVSLTAPSGLANRAIGAMPLYKQLKTKNPNFTTLDFRILQYREFF